MVSLIAHEIAQRRIDRHEPQINFLAGISACRRDLRKALKDYQGASKSLIIGRSGFWGYEYEIPQEDGKSIIRVFCGAKPGDPGSDIKLRVSVHPADQEGISAHLWGSQEYILRSDDSIVVTKDDTGGYLIDGTKQEHRATLNKVQVLAEEVKAKLDAFLPKKA